MMNEAIILAGGLGTRLRSVVEERPKSMALINEKPFLEYLFDFLITQGINRFILSVGYKSTFITEHFKNECTDLSKSVSGCVRMHGADGEHRSY